MKFAFATNGLRDIRTIRASGTMVALYDNRRGQYQPGWIGLDWFTTCLDHGITCDHRTKADADLWMKDPAGWCEDCAAERPAPPADRKPHVADHAVASYEARMKARARRIRA